MPLVGGADCKGTASSDPTDLRFDRRYRASPTGLCLDNLSGRHASASISIKTLGGRSVRHAQ
eukprot:6203303-Pleurochrysis_carterae.AAC.4